MSLSITRSSFSSNLTVSVNAQDFLVSRGTPSKSILDKKHFKKTRSGSRLLGKNLLTQNATYVRANLTEEVNYRGPELDYRITRNTSYEESITLREVLNQKAIVNQCFAFYTNGRGLEARDWYRTRSHTISDRQIRSKSVTRNYSGHGSRLGGVSLHTEYRNLQVNLDFDPDSMDNHAGVTERWSFENCQSQRDLVSASVYKSGGYYELPDREYFRSINVNFDSGGETKKATRIIELNGTVTMEITEIYGYAFTSEEVYNVYETGTRDNKKREIRLAGRVNPQVLWKRVEKTTSNYFYDEDGYLVKIRRTGRRLTRLKQETEELEVVTIEGEIRFDDLDSNERFKRRQQQKQYRFNHFLPIRDFTLYDLDRHADYFEGTVRPGDACNDLWVDPKFVARMDRISKDDIIIPDPRNEDEDSDRIYPPVVVGKFLREIELTTITNKSFPFKFEKRNLSKNIEGRYLKNAIALGSVTQNNGKPGLQTRLIRLRDNHRGENRRNYERYRYERYFLNSPDVRGIKTNEGSKSYPEVDDPRKVKAIAETELSIINTQNACTTQINIDYREGIEEGDFVVYGGKRWKVLNVTTNLNIDGDLLICESQNLSLGLYLKPRVNLENRNYC